MIDIYTDGSALDNPGPGGWAAIVIEGSDERHLAGGERRTTNNRMEIMAAIKGLEATPAGEFVRIHSDSKYVVNTMTRNWKRRANTDLWAMLDTEVARHDVEWRWVRGHAGNPYNEQADRLAVDEAKKQADAGYHGRPMQPSAVATETAPARPRLTHLDESGAARMVDVGAKPETQRVAVARGRVEMADATLQLIRSNGFEKGDVIGIARVAGIMAAKQVPSLIPLCHGIPLDGVDVDFTFDGEASRVNIEATARTTAKTGVEMEALTAVSVAALTIYDMCKSVDRGMRIEGVRLVSKSGGRSGDFRAE